MFIQKSLFILVTTHFIGKLFVSARDQRQIRLSLPLITRTNQLPLRFSYQLFSTTSQSISDIELTSNKIVGKTMRRSSRKQINDENLIAVSDSAKVAKQMSKSDISYKTSTNTRKRKLEAEIISDDKASNAVSDEQTFIKSQPKRKSKSIGEDADLQNDNKKKRKIMKASSAGDGEDKVNLDYTLTGTFDESKLKEIMEKASQLPKTRDGWKVIDGLKHLIHVDSRFKELICKYGLPSILQDSGNRDIDPFNSLLETIIYQQLALGAAKTVYERFVNALSADKKLEVITPQDILNTSFEVKEINGKRKILVNGLVTGLSWQKSNYIRSLAEHFADESKLKGVNLSKLSDNDLFKHLISIKGLGEWSVHMFMMFTLHRPDVLPLGDLALRRGMCSFFGLSRKRIESTNSSPELTELCKSWSPYSSLASLYMWDLSKISKKEKVKKSKKD